MSNRMPRERRSRAARGSGGLSWAPIIRYPAGVLAAAAERFAARSADAERLGKLPSETVADFIELGVPRMLMPKRWGGLELGLPAVLDMASSWAHACMSTAWCAAIFAE